MRGGEELKEPKYKVGDTVFIVHKEGENKYSVLKTVVLKRTTEDTVRHLSKGSSGDFYSTTDTTFSRSTIYYVADRVEPIHDGSMYEKSEDAAKHIRANYYSIPVHTADLPKK